MGRAARSRIRWLLGGAVMLLVVVGVAVSGLMGGGRSSELAAGAAALPKSASAPAPVAAQVATPIPTPVPVKPLKVDPVKGFVGDSFTVSGENLPPGKEVIFEWATVDGSFVTEAYTETIIYQDRKFVGKRVPFGRAVADGEGRVKATFTAPEDYGEIHDIWAAVDGKDVARGGYRILPDFTVTPLEGPIGTPITIKGRGIGVKVWENSWEIGYDNKFAGWISAVTTRGSATAVIRAAGPVGKRVIDIWHGGQGVPYLNWEQSPQSHIPIFSFVFNVTADRGAPPLTLEWPDAGPPTVPTDSLITTAHGPIRPDNPATITPLAGPILTKATLRVRGLPANSPVDLYWMTARGSRTSGLGWGLADEPLGQATADKEGNLVKEFEVPDDLGGWHTVKVVQGDKLLAEAAYLIQPSLVDVTPKRVKVGEQFTVHIKGVGWTELDNTYAVTYDNGYIGFACGFNSNGDVTINFRASGQPGTHLIDLYPLIYQAVGNAKPPLIYDIPMLTFGRDHPSLKYGYRLPAFRLAIEVVE